MPLNRTPLYETHAASGAKLVDFGGWEMPLNYGSQIEEHHAVRRDAGMFDVSHMRPVDLEGADARAFLRVLLANNVDKLTQPGKALYSCMLNECGRRDRRSDRLLTCATTAFRVVVNASTADKDIAWMRQVAADRGLQVCESRRGTTWRSSRCRVRRRGRNSGRRGRQRAEQPRTLRHFLPPKSNDSVRRAHRIHRRRRIRNHAAGAAMRLGLWSDLKAAGVAEAGLGARDTLRLEAGMNLYGNDMDEAVSPLDAGLAWTVDLKTPREFIGRAALEQALENARSASRWSG